MICSLTGAVASEIVSNSMQILDESKLSLRRECLGAMAKARLTAKPTS